MHNIFIIARREYLERVRSRAFVIMTFFIPLLMLGVTVVPSMLMLRGTGETKHMVVVSADPETAEMIRSRIEQRQDEAKTAKQEDANPPKRGGLNPARYTVEVSTDTSDAARTALADKVNKKELDGFLWVTPEAIAA